MKTKGMGSEEIKDALLERIGAPENEPSQSPIGRFVRNQDVSLQELAEDLDRTAYCADLAQEVRALGAWKDMLATFTSKPN